MSQFTVDQALEIALQYQHTGQLVEAEDIYRQILVSYPDQVDALHLLGILAHQCNRHQVAEEMIRKALAAAPKSAPKTPYRVSLGTVLQAQNRLDDAIALYQQAVADDPHSPDAFSHLGVALSTAGRFLEAVKAFENAVSLSPDHPAANGNLGIALCHLGRHEDAIRALRLAIAQQPNVPAFHASLAAAMFRVGQFDAAAAACHQALALDPNHGQANQTLSLVYSETGRLPEAAEAAKRAAETLPDILDTQLNYGEILGKLGRLDEAAAIYRLALQRDKNSADLRTNLANTLKDQGYMDDALAEFREASRLRPQSAAYHSNLLYVQHFSANTAPAALFEEHRQFNRIHALPLAPEKNTFPNSPDPNRPLRIGYISNEFRGHVVGLNLMPLFSHHHREHFETFCYADVKQPDFFTFRFQQLADHFTSVLGRTDAQIADLVRHDQIDILVDLSLHLGGNRLLVFARKPAPIQISFAGYPGTTGLTAIDYRLTDRFLDPPEALPAPSSEIPLRLPDSFWCYFPQHDDIPVNTLPAKDLGFITFGNLNNFCKINERTLELYALIMRGTTRSRLLMLTPDGSHRRRTEAFLEKHGIAPDRVDFVPRQPPDKYMRTYHRIDLGLDSFPYNGHTTSLDSFFMGVPVVTITGNSPVSRAGWCQLANLGLPELAATSPSDFVHLATRLANDWPRLAELRANLRPRMQSSPLMDQKRFTRNIEEAYRQAWRTWCESPPK